MVVDRLATWLEREFETDADSLALVRMIYALLLLTTALPRWLWIPSMSPSFYQPPPGLASLFSAPPQAWFFYGLNAVLVASAVSLFFGLYSRTASIAIAIGLFVGNSFGYAFGKIDHDWILILVPLAGAVAGWGQSRSLDASVRSQVPVFWPVTLVALATGFGMAYAGVMKALTGWLSVDHLAVRSIVIDNAISNDRANAVASTAIEAWPWVFWEAMDWTTVAFEYCFVAAAFRRRWFLVACAAAAGFHFANAAILKLQFSVNLPAYALAIHWAVPKWLRPELVPKVVAVSLAVAGAALYTLVGNPVFLLSTALGWEVTYAPQWPFTAAAFAISIWWIAARSGLFSVSQPVPANRLVRIRTDEDSSIVLFDGHCGLCNEWVDLVIRHDRRGTIRFLPLQTPTGEALLSLSDLPSGYTDSILLLHRRRVYTHSTAVLRTLSLTRGPLALAAILLVVPAPVRDVVYSAVAAKRYRWFGRHEACRLPTAAERSRFLTETPS